MNQKALAARIAGILDGISRLNNDVCAMGTLDIQRCPENYEALSTQAALAAEKIACQLRSLLYATTRVPKSEYLARAGDAHGIEIGETDGVLEITLPCLLPKKRSRQSALFLGDPLHTALKEYMECHPMPRFRECTVCFFHVYGGDLPLCKLPDYLKIVEVVPVNFLLRSAAEQRGIVYSFLSWLKISPVKLQFKVLTRRAEISRHIDAVRREMEREPNKPCRQMQEDYLHFISQISSREAVTRRFFLIFEYEPWSNARPADEEREAAASLQTAVRTASNYLHQCGNEVLIAGFLAV